VKILSEINHENIAQLYGFILRDNIPEILMEYAGKKAGHSQAFLFLACLAASAKLILFLQTLYVYCVYAAMSKNKKI
jgi:hypothetical protein